MNKYPIAIHYGGLHNGTPFRVLRITAKGAHCRPVSWGNGIASHTLKVSNLELESEGDTSDESISGIVADLS